MATRFEMLTRVVLRPGGAGAPGNQVAQRAHKMAKATGRLAALLQTKIFPSWVKRSEQRVAALQPLGGSRQFGVTPRPVLLLEDYLRYEIFLQRTCNITALQPNMRWGGWFPLYRNLPPPQWEPNSEGFHELVRPKFRVRTKSRAALLPIRGM